MVAKLRARVMYGLKDRDKSQVRQVDAKPNGTNDESTMKSRYFAALGAQGGKARLTKITKKRRREIARIAARARWG
jgi:hypothetical protein